MKGAYTGEVTAHSLSGLASYSIIGHSERRRFFAEDDKKLALKTKWAKAYGMEVIYCIQNPRDPIPEGVNIIAYEPVSAIGTGHNEDVSNVVAFKKKVALPKNTIFLYGGSVNSSNIASYRSSPEIDGFLIATASQDPVEFFKILQA